MKAAARQILCFDEREGKREGERGRVRYIEDVGQRHTVDMKWGG
jgi:hypothetical protein